MGTYFLHSGELRHHGVKGMKWGVRKNSIRKQAKLSKKRDILAARAKRLADENFVAARNIKKDAKGMDDVDLISKGLYAAGKRYLETHKELLSMNMSDVRKRQLDNVYRRGVREANKLNYGIDAFDLRDR